MLDAQWPVQCSAVPTAEFIENNDYRHALQCGPVVSATQALASDTSDALGV